MSSSLLFSCLRYKSRIESFEDKVSMPSTGKRYSAWSYSYDLALCEKVEAGVNLANKCEYSETDVKDKSNSWSLDLDNEFVLQGNRQIHELAMIESVRSPSSEVSSNINLKIPEESSVKRLRLSDLQHQRSWLDKITGPIPNDEMQRGRSKSQIQAIIDYLPQFIQDTALPTILKYEQLQNKYYLEKNAWKKQVEFLEREISLLRSELQNVDKANSDTKNELTNLRKIHNQNQLSIGEKGNFPWSVPHSNEIKTNFDLNLEAKETPDVRRKCPLSELQYTGETEEFTDLKLGFHRGVKHLDLERIAKENENQIYYDNLPNVKEKVYPEDSLNLQRKLQQESLRGRNSKDYLQLKNRRVPRTVFIDQKVFEQGDSSYLHNQDEAASTLNRKVVKVKKEGRICDSPKISPASTFQSLGYIDQYGVGCGRSNKRGSRTAIRSQWL